ncbi:MAG: isoprenylcysteine carboxyl methyltransferase family protein [Bacteroidales bacterium]
MVKAYFALVALVASARVAELVVSARHVRRSRARGGVELGARDYPAMVATHAAFLAACPLEVWWFGRPWIPALGVPMLCLVAAAFALRYWSIATLGDRWCTRVIVVPGDRLVRRGPYRWLRHPNYTAVVVEFVALPLVHTAWMTAIGFSALHAFVLHRRVTTENAALARWGRQ